MKRLTVHAASRTYPILVGRGVLDELGAAVLRAARRGPEIVVLCDENVEPLYLDRTRRSRRPPGCARLQVILHGQQKVCAAPGELSVLYDRGCAAATPWSLSVAA